MDKTLACNFLSIIRHYFFRLLLASLMVLISNGLLIINPLIFREALSALDPAASNLMTERTFFHSLFGSYFHSLGAWAALLFSVAILSALLKYGMRMVFLTVSREVELQIRAKMFDRIESQSRSFFDRYGIGDLLSRLTNDITAYRDMIGPGMMYPMYFLTMMIPALATLIYLSPLMATVSVIPIVVIYLINLWVRRPLLHISQKVQKSLADMSTMVHEHYSGIKLIKSYVIENATLNLFKELCYTFSYLNMRLVSFQGMFFPALVLITKIITVSLVVVAAAIILLEWGKGLSLADFLTFMWIQSYIFSPLLMLAWIMPIYQKGKAAYLRLVEIYEEPIEVYEKQDPLPSLPEQADIELRNLTFYYPNREKPALSHINLKIKGGTFVGITGPVGSGKTTLFRLLNREYEVPHGRLLIGGQDIHHYSLDAFHQDVVIVEQLPFLFSKSIRDNIRFGNHRATENEITEVAQQADVHDDILGLPNQYDTVVGERGVSLSGGQKQRLAIARALLVNRSILLLDDIFSAVDTGTEKKIFEELRSNFAGKTILIISHRVSILEQVDRILYLKEGKIVEDGTPEELVKKEGPYNHLVHLQKI